MKILWLSVNSGLYNNLQSPNSYYNGGGWISSLQKLILMTDNTLALAYITHTQQKKEIQDKTIYYPIYEASKNSYQKIKEYYGGYKKKNNKKYLDQIERIIQDFQPDIIHLFGLENPLATILGNTSVPIVVHLQGLLAPYDNAFFPVGFNKSSFLFPFSKREWIYRNGYIFAKENIHIRGQIELDLFKKVHYAMGRTNWDHQISQLLSPKSNYFHVDEVLREPFYEKAGSWLYHNNKDLRIVSTLSNTIYKGLDVILKTALLLQQEGVSFKWQIIGIRQQDPIIRFFEKKIHIVSQDVNIEYIGVLNDRQLCNKLLENHIYVHPSYIDNSPNSVCEAQLIGMPVIGTYVGGIPSLISNEKDGLLVPANAPFELAYLLKKCSLEKDFASKIGRQGFITAAQRHNKATILKDLLHTYSSIINTHDNI